MGHLNPLSIILPPIWHWRERKRHRQTEGKMEPRNWHLLPPITLIKDNCVGSTHSLRIPDILCVCVLLILLILTLLLIRCITCLHILIHLSYYHIILRRP